MFLFNHRKRFAALLPLERARKIWMVPAPGPHSHPWRGANQNPGHRKAGSPTCGRRVRFIAQPHATSARPVIIAACRNESAVALRSNGSFMKMLKRRTFDGVPRWA